MKRLITQFTLLVAALCLSVSAHAYDCIVGSMYYVLDKTNNTAEIESCEKDVTEITIPESITYEGTTYSVTSIANNAFSDCTAATTLTIPRSMKTVGRSAFSGCGLTSVEIPGSVTSIGAGAFRLCSELTSVTFNAEKCTTMGTSSNSAFKECEKLTSLTIGKDVASIPMNAFKDCTLLTELKSLAANPPVCGTNALKDINKTTCTLYVLNESVDLYKAAAQWKNFSKIEGTLGVEDVAVDGVDDDAETLYDVYNIQGMKVAGGLRRADMNDTLPRGIYILVSPDGTRKVKI